MILLDTNVLSAVMRREPEASVVRWLNAQPPESVWTTSITVFEVRLGLELLAAGRRRRMLEEAFSTWALLPNRIKVCPAALALGDERGDHPLFLKS